jgi:hydrogenase maturation protease
MGNSPRILVAGMGNVLRRDDGFGIAVVQQLRERQDLPPGVALVEGGIAGVRVVQELLDGYDALILVDATTRGCPPGTLYELEPDHSSLITHHSSLDSLHTVEPSRILTLARAAGCLPPRVLVVGCEPADCDELSEDFTPAVAAAVPRAVALVLQRTREWQQPTTRQ